MLSEVRRQLGSGYSRAGSARPLLLELSPDAWERLCSELGADGADPEYASVEGLPVLVRREAPASSVEVRWTWEAVKA